MDVKKLIILGISRAYGCYNVHYSQDVAIIYFQNVEPDLYLQWLAC